MTMKELRLSRNLSQAAFAGLLGVSPGLIGRLENGRAKVSARIADKVWEVFGVEIGVEEKQVIKKVSVPKLEIYIQSPYGGNITPEEVAGRMPEGTEACFVRVDQNLIWWVKTSGETGAVEIWPDNRT